MLCYSWDLEEKYDFLMLVISLLDQFIASARHISHNGFIFIHRDTSVVHFSITDHFNFLFFFRDAWCEADFDLTDFTSADKL